LHNYLIPFFVVLVLNSNTLEAKKESTQTNSVKGYVKKDGTYVAPHHRTNPNNTQRDNWSSKPNYNPHTGKDGKKEPIK